MKRDGHSTDIKLAICSALLLPHVGAAAIEDVLKSVCIITVADKHGTQTGQGSAVIVYASGQAVTCFHVLNGAHTAKVKFSNGSECGVGGFSHADPDNDVANISLEGEEPFTPIAIGAVKDVNIGDEVHSAGNPKGCEGTASFCVFGGQS